MLEVELKLKRDGPWPDFFLLICLISIVFEAHAWGPKGHSIVGHVADKNLTPKARALALEILSGKSLAAVANVADVIKFLPFYTHTKPWHFITVPDSMDLANLSHSEDGDVVQAIKSQIEVLRSSRSDADERVQALMYLVHFVGDIHQPLHVGREDDRGGNDLKLIYNGKRTNLHALWDTDLISDVGLDAEAYARFLQLSLGSTPSVVRAELPLSLILEECRSARTAIYELGSRKGASVLVPEQYFKSNQGLLNRQLLTGGLRLAALLNFLFEDSYSER